MPAQRRLAAKAAVFGVVGLVGLAPVACSSGGSGKEPPKAPLQGQVLEWNMSGFSLHKGAVTPVGRLVQEVTARRAGVVAVVTEETCSAQFDRLRQALAPLGFQGVANWSIPSFGQPGCASFGNTVFWRGAAAQNGVQMLTYPASTQAQGAATQEQRNLVCVAFTVPAGDTAAATPMRVCGTHLDKDQPVSARQAPVALATLDQDNRTGPPTFLLGDFNLFPTNPVLDGFYARYREADLSPRTQVRTTTTGKFPFKYDYGFVPRGPVDVPVTADVIPVPTLSDHAIYVLHFAFR